MLRPPRAFPMSGRPNYRAFFFMAALLLLATPAYAQQMPSVDQMFANFNDASTSLIDLVVNGGMVLGIFLGIFSLLKFKEYNESGGRMKLSTPLGLTVVSALLIALPGTINLATETLSLGANTGKDLLSDPSGGSGATAAMGAGLKGVLLFIKLVGHIAIVRGLLVLKRMADGQNEGMGHAITWILGGAFAVNINATASILVNTFAPGMNVPF